MMTPMHHDDDHDDHDDDDGDDDHQVMMVVGASSQVVRALSEAMAPPAFPALRTFVLYHPWLLKNEHLTALAKVSQTSLGRMRFSSLPAVGARPYFRRTSVNSGERG
jgi:hypothetical protein